MYVNSGIHKGANVLTTIQETTTTSATMTTTKTTKLKSSGNTKMRQIQEFNELLSCYLCDGYMIDPTTIENCAHTFCRSCILKHLLNSEHCPQCGNAGKSINVNHLGSDNTLRALIYKLVPGLYQSEKQRHIQFYGSKKRNPETKLEDDAASIVDDALLLTSGDGDDDDFFLPTEPISLSLEYHPALLQDCQETEIPPVRYLQCPASVQIQHLKRFLYSKFALDPHNGKIIVEIMYEDEILPDDFMLMDVGYSYNWKREAPMRFTYRILLYNDPPCNVEPLPANNQTTEPRKSTSQKAKTSTSKPQKTVTFAAETKTFDTTTTPMTKVPSNATNSSNKTPKVIITKDGDEESRDGGDVEAPTTPPASMKVVIARKTTESRKASNKRSHGHSHSSGTYHAEEPLAPTSDFKSLRSNDIRFSDYTITPAPSTKSQTKAATAAKAQNASRLSIATTAATTKSSQAASASPPQATVVPIVVSIPQSQVSKSPYSLDDHIDNVSLAQLRNACKKSPNQSSVPQPTNGGRSPSKSNLPKLKIELNTMKAKLTIPKPKSAGVIYSDERPPAAKKSKYRKHSLDESGPLVGKVDQETYAKSIGLKPIEVVTPALDTLDTGDKYLKYSPNASPMSSCSSSTNSSSNGNFPAFADGSGGGGHSTSHKKHKKKHSKESREAKEGKRRKLHAEISSQPADESLKMKVKITNASAPHSHKSHKSKSTPPTTPATLTPPVEHKSMPTPPKSPPKSPPNAAPVVINTTPAPPAPPPVASPGPSTPATPLTPPTPTPPKINKVFPKVEATINMVALNKTLGEEAQSIKKLMRDKPDVQPKPQSLPTPITPTRTHPPLLPKPVSSVKEMPKVPTSPPLPPSLFKTIPSTFANASTLAPLLPNLSPNSIASSLSCITKPTISPPTKPQSFAVPNPPRPKLLSAPSSIASSANKQAASMQQLKRSASLDDPASLLSKQQRLDQDRLMRRTAYGPALGAGCLPAATSKLLQQQFQIKDERALSGMEQASFYSPLMTPYGLGGSGLSTQRTTTPTGISSPPLSISKFNETLLKSAAMNSRTATLPHMTQAQLSFLAASSSYPQPALLNKSSLEIVRLPAQQTTMEAMTLPPPLSPPKTSRLMGPPISIANKVKKPAPLSPSTLAAVKMANYAAALSSAATPTTPASSITNTMTTKNPSNNNNNSNNSNNNVKKVSFRSSPPALINLRNTLPLKPTSTIKSPSPLASPPMDVAALKLSPKAAEHTKANGVAEKLKSITSLREFRPVSKDSSNEILDLSGGKDSTTTPTTSSNSIQAALHKMKQSITTCTVSCTENNSTATKTTNSVAATKSNAGDDLQNLHLLSESATAREKIAIRSQSVAALAATTATTSASVATNSLQSYFDKSKQQTSSLVRQQNASVRNIPNPSALAFRNQQPVPVSAPVPMPTPATATTSTPAIVVTTSTTTTTAASSASNATAIGMKSPPKVEDKPAARPAKKLTTIDEVAATLNIRAAEASAARAALTAAQEDIKTAKVAAEKNVDAAVAAVATTKSTASETNSKTTTNTTTAKTVAAAMTTSATTATTTTSTPTVNDVAVKSTVTPSPPSVPTTVTTLASKNTDSPPITASLKQPSSPFTNNNNNNNNNANTNNNNNNSNNVTNNNNNNNNTTPASTSAPLSTALSSSSPSGSESNQTSLAIQGNV